MTRPPQHELFVSERPVHSEDAMERVYARRRRMTVAVLALIVAGALYAFSGGGPTNPSDIPTIKADGTVRQKPADPGGIDIPHQDVRVYDQLEGKRDNAQAVEHLLPPPEVPKEAPPSPRADGVAPTVDASAPVPTAAPVAPVTETPAPVAAPTAAAKPGAKSAAKDEILDRSAAAKSVSTTVAVPPAPAAVPAPLPEAAAPAPSSPAPASLAVPAASAAASVKTPKAPAAPPVTIDQLLNRDAVPAKADDKVAKTDKTEIAAPKTAPVAAGKAVIQLASMPNEAQAQATMKSLQQKHAQALGGVSLHVVRADLGGRGVYYRIQSQGIAESDAARICSSLKQANAGCILVRK